MIKFLKNEIIKMLDSKKIYTFLIFLIFMIVTICYIVHSQQNNIISNASEAKKYPEQIKMNILNMNSVIFLKQFSTEFIFRPVVPYFAFFMVAFSVEIFGGDFFSGNMKYFARLDKNHINIFKAKVLSLIVYSFLFVLITIVLGFIISSLAYKISFNGLGRIILIYLAASIPVASFGLIIGIMSMSIKNRSISLTLGIFISIFVTVCDRLTISRNFSPLGVISIMEKARDSIHLSSLLMANVVSVIYLAVAYFIGKRIFKNKEFNY
jgi:ABC-2 type transport system permease protein